MTDEERKRKLNRLNKVADTALMFAALAWIVAALSIFIRLW